MITVEFSNIGAMCEELSRRDAVLARVCAKYGTPPVWEREPTFATLIHIILEQQVSLASALAAFNKLKENVTAVTPSNLLALTDEKFRNCYFSRQKTSYARALAAAVESRSLDIGGLRDLSDDEVRAELKKIKGIGDWTADIFLLMALRRTDVMPRGDLALHIAYQKLHGLEKPPKSDEFLELTAKWRPHRAVAARILWHSYLSEKLK
jgi:DNA-3-methyladenine glycosylase II